MEKNLDKLNPSVVLGVAAHPDDLDFGASGAMALFAEQGADIYYLILTDGSKGSEDRKMTSSQLHKIRIDEQEEAVKAIGGKGAYFLKYTDGELIIDLNLKRDIVKYIRKLKPDVVITMDPSMIYSSKNGFINHPDHRAAGQATLDAVFPLARDHMAFPELLDKGFEPHRVSTVLLNNFDQHNFAVDISGTIKKKVLALKAHRSQIKDLDKIGEVIKQRAERAGKQYGVELAEVFVRIDIN